MVQDVFAPEIYLDVFEEVDESTGARRRRTGRFRDASDLAEGRRLDMDSQHNVYRGRQVLYCVPIPAETEWAKSAHAGKSQIVAVDGDGSGSGAGSGGAGAAAASGVSGDRKRRVSRDDDEDDEEDGEVVDGDEQENGMAVSGMEVSVGEGVGVRR